MSGRLSNVRQDVGDAEYIEVCAFVRKHRPPALTKEERLDILRMHAYLRNQKARSEQFGVSDVSTLIASMLGRSKKTVQAVWRDYVNENTITASTPPGNTMPKTSRIPRTPEIIASVQRFVRERRQLRARVVAKDVMVYLAYAGILTYDTTSKKSTATALRSVQLFLVHCGYERGNRKGQQSLALTERNTILRDEYVMLVCSSTQFLHRSYRRTIVYLDESFVHHHYAKNDVSLFDPHDALDQQPKAKHKGQRYCFIGAIVDGGEDDSKFVCYDRFVGGKRQTKDYHGMFDHTYFVAWFRRLLDKLARLNLENTMIVMDNAKYHKVRPSDTPKFEWKKADLQQACARLDIAFDLGDLKSTLWSRLKPHVETVKPVVVTMAQEEGHEVVYSAPHHSNLQPIETVWAVVKGEVGRLYDVNTSFAVVGARLDASIARLSSSTFHGCIRKSERDLLDLYKHISVVDNEIYDQQSPVASDDSSDSQSTGSVAST